MSIKESAQKLYRKMMTAQVYAILFDCDISNGWLTVRAGYSLEEVRENIEETHHDNDVKHADCKIMIRRYVKQELEELVDEFSEGKQKMKEMKR